MAKGWEGAEQGRGESVPTGGWLAWMPLLLLHLKSVPSAPLPHCSLHVLLVSSSSPLISLLSTLFQELWVKGDGVDLPHCASTMQGWFWWRTCSSFTKQIVIMGLEKRNEACMEISQQCQVCTLAKWFSVFCLLVGNIFLKRNWKKNCPEYLYECGGDCLEKSHFSKFLGLHWFLWEIYFDQGFHHDRPKF